MVADYPTAIDVLSKWHVVHRQLFLDAGAQSEFVSGNRESASLKISSASHLIEMVVWNHAWAMDVQVIELATEESRFPIVGSNASREALEARLSEFLKWFQSANQSAA